MFIQEQNFKVTIFRTLEASGKLKVTGEVTQQELTTIKKVILVLEGEMKRQQIQDALQIKHNDYFRVEYITPALEQKYIELKYPKSNNHPNQKYRLTAKGLALKAKLNDES